MIDSIEIKAKASEFQISPINVQRDYVFGWLLYGIFSNTFLKDTLILKGGNALRKAYLPNTRFSKDLDFSTLKAVDTEIMKEQIQNSLKEISERSGIQFFPEKTIIQPKFELDNRQIYKGRIVFQGFNEPEEIPIKVQMDITEFDQIILPVQQRTLIHPYSDEDICTAQISCHKLEEILASKLTSQLKRRRVSDLFDLVFAILINKTYSIERSEVIRTFLKKSIFNDEPATARNQLLSLDIEESRGFWKELIAPVTSLFGFDEAAANFRELVNLLFGYLPTIAQSTGGYRGSAFGEISYGGGSRLSYFSADYRNRIMTAGRNEKLIRLLYNGKWRSVEPYKLEYYRKKNGEGNEYFWGYDRTGGNSGKISTKMFFSDQIQDVVLTDDTFSPQWPIEL